MPGIMEGLPRYPFEILPKEIWEILEVKDSEDLRNLMKASKQLDNSFWKIRHLWLLDKVLPILATITCKLSYLGDEDVIKLRLVDKRWCGAVNTFLVNQPSLRPYNKDDDKLNSEAHIWSHEWNSSFGNVILRNDEDQLYGFGETLKTLREFGNSERNPFPSRSIVRYPQDKDNWEWRLENPELWGELEQEASQKLGKHVWFLEMEWAKDEEMAQYRLESNPSSVWEWILHSLTFLPNLKSLHLKIASPMEFTVEKMTNSEAKEFLQLEENQLPPLPFLESLTICQFDNLLPNLFSQKLMSNYSLQLRRLQISAKAWESREKWMFPNLTELHLDSIKRKAKVNQILISLEAPQLAKLKLTSRGNRTFKMEEDIFPWIALFPSLLCLDISAIDISENGTLEAPRDSMSSLKYLKIRNSPGVNYKFLLCLPSLQRLLISANREPVVWDCSAYSEVKIKLEIETNSLYESNVWELCPKLRSLSVKTKHFRYKEFDRTTYEKLSKIEEHPDKKLRRDILDFLQNIFHLNYNFWHARAEIARIRNQSDLRL